MSGSKLSIQDMVSIGLCTAIIAVLAQLVIPMPSGVPLTMQSFAVTLIPLLFGAKNGALAALLYLLIGSVGLPVFTGFRGGLQCLLDPTGGFLLTFPLMAWLIGLGIEKKQQSQLLFYSLFLLGTISNYAGGLFLFCFTTGSTLTAGFAACVLPFIPTAVLKAVLALWLYPIIRKQLHNSLII